MRDIGFKLVVANTCLCNGSRAMPMDVGTAGAVPIAQDFITQIAAVAARAIPLKR